MCETDAGDETDVTCSDDGDIGGQGAVTSGKLGYVADGAAGLRVIDVHDIFNPVEIGYYDTPGTAWKVKVVGGFAYVADGEGGLQIISLRCP